MSELEQLKQENQRLRAALAVLVNPDHWREVDCGETTVYADDLWIGDEPENDDINPIIVAVLAASPDAVFSISRNAKYDPSSYSSGRFEIMLGDCFIGYDDSEQRAGARAVAIRASVERMLEKAFSELLPHSTSSP